MLTNSAIVAEPETVGRAEPERGGRAAEPGGTRSEVRPGLFKEARKPPAGYRLDLSALDLGKTMKELTPLPFVIASMDVGAVSDEESEDIVITDRKKVLGSPASRWSWWMNMSRIRARAS